MEGELNTHAVIIEVIEDATFILVKRSKFIKAKIIAVGTCVAELKKDDTVLCYNEGRLVSGGNRKGRIINDAAVVIKF